jgi:hypothetical protein
VAVPRLYVRDFRALVELKRKLAYWARNARYLILADLASRKAQRNEKMQWMSKIALPLAVLLTVAHACGQCPQDLSGLLDQVTANGLQSLNSLHDYVWIVEDHVTRREGKQKIRTVVYRQQNVVANGKMYSRILKPGEEPSLPESEAALSADYHVRVVSFECAGESCMYSWAFLQAILLRQLWNVRQVKEGELQGKKMLVMDLQAKNLPHPGYGPISGTAWVDAERCRLVRLQTTYAKPNGHDQEQEVFQFGEIKGNWLPVRREKRGDGRGHGRQHIVEWGQEYTYLKFGSSTLIGP